MSFCPCSPNTLYKDCCQAIHNGTKLADSAEALMRSRYAAFAKSDGLYLHKSHYRKTRPTLKEMHETARWAKSVSWIKLEVINKTKGGLADIEGTVYFKAYFMENGKIEVIEENSYFKKENGEWFYVGLA